MASIRRSNLKVRRSDKRKGGLPCEAPEADARHISDAGRRPRRIDRGLGLKLRSAPPRQRVRVPAIVHGHCGRIGGDAGTRPLRGPRRRRHRFGARGQPRSDRWAGRSLHLPRGLDSGEPGVQGLLVAMLLSGFMLTLLGLLRLGSLVRRPPPEEGGLKVSPNDEVTCAKASATIHGRSAALRGSRRWSKQMRRRKSSVPMRDRRGRVMSNRRAHLQKNDQP
jgi:hypothetical protein